MAAQPATNTSPATSATRGGPAPGAARTSSDSAPLPRRRGRRAPRKLRFTREGKIFVGVTLGVGVAALNTANNLLYLVLGLLLSIIILSGILSEIALVGLEFRRRLPRRSFAGTAMHVEIEVKNKKRYAPSYSIEVEDRIADRRTDKRCYFLKVAAGARQTAAYRRTPPVRGREQYLALRVATRFPFGLFEKWREVDLVDEQLVYPAPAKTPRAQPRAASNGDMVPRNGRGHGDVDGVRELSPDEPVRDVDWKKSASRDRLVARERRREGQRRVRIELANRPPADEASLAEFSARFEEDLRRAAWSALEALREGCAVELIAHDVGNAAPGVLRALPSSASADRVLAFLARLPPAPPLPDPSVVPSTPSIAPLPPGTRAASIEPAAAGRTSLEAPPRSSRTVSLSAPPAPEQTARTRRVPRDGATP